MAHSIDWEAGENKDCRPGLNHPPASAGGISLLVAFSCRSDLNHPPASAGGISLSVAFSFRLGLNHPPASAGGISLSVAFSFRLGLNHPPASAGGISALAPTDCRTASFRQAPLMFDPKSQILLDFVDL